MTTRALATTAVLLLAVSVAGCGTDDPGAGDAADDQPSSQSPSQSPSVPPSSVPPTLAPPDSLPDPTRAPDVVTATGVVTAGVEAGCLLLGGTPYLLLPGPGDVPGLAGLREGDGVEVTGRASPETITTCQQGVPLQVTTLRRLGPS